MVPVAILLVAQHYKANTALTKMKRLQLGCCSYAAIKYVCNNWWQQSSQLELFAATLQLLSAATGSQSNYSQSVAASGCHKQEDSKNSFFII